MRLIAEVQNPDSIELTITTTMAVKEWRELLAALKSETYSERWSAAKFHELLREQIGNLEHRAFGTARVDEK